MEKIGRCLNNGRIPLASSATPSTQKGTGVAVRAWNADQNLLSGGFASLLCLDLRQMKRVDFPGITNNDLAVEARRRYWEGTPCQLRPNPLIEPSNWSWTGWAGSGTMVSGPMGQGIFGPTLSA